MPAYPSSLSLTNIADGALAVAADERNNFNAIQTYTNTLLTALAVAAKGDILAATGANAVTPVTVGANGKAIIADSTQTAGLKWDYPPGYELDYVQRVTQFNVTDVLEVTATALLTSSAITFDGSAVWVEFFSETVGTPSAAAGNITVVTLFEGATQIGRLGIVRTAAAAQASAPVFGKFKFTPTAGAHTYKACAFATNTTGTPFVDAGSGGTGNPVPAYLRFTKA